MRWYDARDAIGEALREDLEHGTMLYALGEELRRRLNQAIHDYASTARPGAPEPKESPEYIEWRDVTMPTFIMDVLNFVAEHDGQPVGDPPGPEKLMAAWHQAQKRAKQAATDAGFTAVGGLLQSVAALRPPAAPPRYTGTPPSIETRNALAALDRLIDQVNMWLERVNAT